MPPRSVRSGNRPLVSRPLPRGARDLAFLALDESKSQGGFVRQILEDAAGSAMLSGADRGLALELTYGVIRRQATLNAILLLHLRRPRHSIEGPLWTLLQIGAYQLVFLQTIPHHAAVDETVETAKRLGRRRWTGLLNGTLRSVAGTLTDEFGCEPAADAVPLPGGRFRRYGRVAFPDPNHDPAGYFSRAFSFPDWLVARWLRRFDVDELMRIGFWFNSSQPVFLRANSLVTSRDALLAALAGAGIAATPGSLPESVRLGGGSPGDEADEPAERSSASSTPSAPGAESSEPVRARHSDGVELRPTAARMPPIPELPGYEEGWFAVQDETAMRAAILLDPQPGFEVLDLCAAPGTKATHLAERMQNRGRVLACEIHPDRLPRIAENARRLRTSIVDVGTISADGSDIPAGPFDAVLVDVPCTNTGVLGKRPEARWRIRPRDLAELPVLQTRLLLDACQRLRPGGRVAYSTCSIEPEENEQVVKAVLSRVREMSLISEFPFCPGRPADGGYQALLTRK